MGMRWRDEVETKSIPGSQSKGQGRQAGRNRKECGQPGEVCMGMSARKACIDANTVERDELQVELR